MDRLQPVKAVELLEIIKNFMDCEGCVFLLAVDTNVIKYGIVQKYGLSKEKSQAFFGKLIQLPFLMPVSYYNYESYVESILPDDEEFHYHSEFYNMLDEVDKKDVVWLLRMASDRNPRAAKRVVNSFIIQDMVMRQKFDYSEMRYILTAKILLALTCIQVKLEPDYQMIIDMVESVHGF